MEIGNKIKEARNGAGLTQDQAAEKIMVSRQTISNWPNVRRAEVKWIYPYQEDADVLFNSSYLVEFAVLRSHAEAILSTVPKNCPEYGEAHRLLMFLHYFVPVSDKDIPRTSFMRSFIGQ